MSHIGWGMLQGFLFFSEEEETEDVEEEGEEEEGEGEEEEGTVD